MGSSGFAVRSLQKRLGFWVHSSCQDVVVMIRWMLTEGGYRA